RCERRALGHDLARDPIALRPLSRSPTGGRRSIATTLAVGAIVLVVTPVYVVTAFRVLATDTFVRHEVERGGFPRDRYGLTTPQRLHLALTGLHSILPGSEGIVLLERATLPDGSPAFDSRELRHMGDVRSRLGAAYRLQLVVLAILVVLAVGLSRSRRWR